MSSRRYLLFYTGATLPAAAGDPYLNCTEHDVEPDPRSEELADMQRIGVACAARSSGRSHPMRCPGP